MSVLADGVTEHDERKSATNGNKSKLRSVKREVTRAKSAGGTEEEERRRQRRRRATVGWRRRKMRRMRGRRLRRKG